ncbi:MAG: TIGR02466 family protein [Verrucomicrobiota bacterium]|nr:TIGR02466 family protein [Verrucomicrobiota bacterium]
MGNIQAWFPTFIYYAALKKSGGAAFNRELLKECYQLREFDEEGKRWSAKNYPGGYTSYASLCKLHQMSSTFGELEKRITQHVKLFAGHLEFDLTGRKLEMTDCWINIMPRHAVHGLHLHPLSTVSGTYYVKTPRNCSSIRFEDPRLSRFMAAPPRRADARPHNRQHVKYKAEAGKLVLFESWLRHEVASNPTEMERISISFNYNWF